MRPQPLPFWGRRFPRFKSGVNGGQMMSKHRSFFNRRLHSLLGVIPVGFFLVEHLITNYEATKGVNAFVEQVEWIWGIPFLPVLEIFFIFLPLLYHGVYGLYIAFTGS